MKSESGSQSGESDQFQPTRTITLPHSWPDLPDGMRLMVRYHDLGFSLQPDTAHDKLVSALREITIVATRLHFNAEAEGHGWEADDAEVIRLKASAILAELEGK